MREVPQPNEQNRDVIRDRTERASVLSDHSFRGYYEYLCLSPEDFPGKTILDLGSGRSEDFSREATERGATVVSLNPKLAQEKTRAEVVELPHWNERSVAGKAQQLPFRDRAFDTIVSFWAIPIWVPDDNRKLYESEMSIILDDCLRVLKPGGKIALSPARSHENMSDQEILEDNFGKEKYHWLIKNNVLIELVRQFDDFMTILIYKPLEGND